MKALATLAAALTLTTAANAGSLIDERTDVELSPDAYTFQCVPPQHAERNPSIQFTITVAWGEDGDAYQFGAMHHMADGTVRDRLVQYHGLELTTNRGFGYTGGVWWSGRLRDDPREGLVIRLYKDANNLWHVMEQHLAWNKVAGKYKVKGAPVTSPCTAPTQVQASE